MCVPTYASAEAFYWTMQNLRKMFEYPYIYGGWGWIPASLILYLALTRVIAFRQQAQCG